MKQKKNNKQERKGGLQMDNRQKEKYAELFTTALDSMECSNWQKPWVSAHHGHPMNLKHKKPYQGVNEFFLTLLCAIRGWELPYFLTFKQIEEMGLSLNLQMDKDGMPVFKDNGTPKFEESFPVVKKLFKIYRNGEKITLEEYDQLTQEEKDECRWYSGLKPYAEWNLSQTNFREVCPEKWEEMNRLPEHDYKEGTRDEVLERMITGGEWRCPIGFGGNRAFFVPSEDRIQLPKREAFMGDTVFYQTAIHEMAHSTAPDVKRELTGMFGDEEYALEEFVAELSSACVCSMLGIGKLLDEHHIAYVQNWRRAIKTNKDVIPVVIDHVQKAVNFLLKKYEEVAAKMEAVQQLPMAA